MWSPASCLRPCLCCLNGSHEWPGLLLRVWASVAPWDFFGASVYCISPLFSCCQGRYVFLTRKIP